jgi:hypothetical protein
MDRVAGVLEISRTDDTHEIVISLPAWKKDADGRGRVMFSSRYARHLANLLLEHATYAEAEAAGIQPESRAYRRLSPDK